MPNAQESDPNKDLTLKVWIPKQSKATPQKCWPQRTSARKGGGTVNLPSNLLDFRGLDSSIIFTSRGEILMSIGVFPESFRQAILVGIILVWRLGVTWGIYRDAYGQGHPKPASPADFETFERMSLNNHTYSFKCCVLFMCFPHWFQDLSATNCAAATSNAIWIPSLPGWWVVVVSFQQTKGGLQLYRPGTLELLDSHYVSRE